MILNKTSLTHSLKQLKQECEKEGITLIGFFGSFARDEAGIYSDVDIAFRKDRSRFQNPYAYFDSLERLKSLLRKNLHRNIDVFDLDSDSPAKNAILKELVYV